MAHNAPFDLGFLAAEFRHAGLPMPLTPVLDTLAVARRCFSFGSNSLDSVATRLGIRTPEHRALADVLTTRKVFEHFVHTTLRDRERVTLGTFLELQGQAPIGVRPTEQSGRPSGDLQDAVRRGNRLRITYRVAAGVVSERLVDPIELIENGRDSYLIAFCHLREMKRTFRIDRILRWDRS